MSQPPFRRGQTKILMTWNHVTNGLLVGYLISPVAVLLGMLLGPTPASRLLPFPPIANPDGKLKQSYAGLASEFAHRRALFVSTFPATQPPQGHFRCREDSPPLRSFHGP